MRTLLVLVLVLSFAIVALTAGCGGGSSPSLTSTASPGSDPGTLPGTPGSGSTNPGGGTAAGTASLSWNAPVANTDGTALTDLRGYKIHYGSSSGSYSRTVDVGKVTSYSLQDLAPGTYYITVTAYNSTETESGFSNEVSKTIL